MQDHGSKVAGLIVPRYSSNLTIPPSNINGLTLCHSDFPEIGMVHFGLRGESLCYIILVVMSAGCSVNPPHHAHVAVQNA